MATGKYKTYIPSIVFTVLIVWTCFVQAQEDVSNNEDVHIAVLLPMDRESVWSLQKTSPAVDIAVGIINTYNILPGVNFHIHRRDSGCSDGQAAMTSEDLHDHGLVHVFIGPACSPAVSTVSWYATHWDIPVLTAGGLGHKLADKNQHRMLTRVGGASTDLGVLVKSVLEVHGLQVPSIILHPDSYTSSHYEYGELALSVHKALGQSNSTLSIQVLPDISNQNSVRDTLENAIQHSNVVMLCMPPEMVRDVMIQAYELNYHQGDHVFINVDVFTRQSALELSWYRTNGTDEENIQAREAYEALLTVGVRNPNSMEYKAFMDEVKQRAIMEYPDVYVEEELSRFVGDFHDAVILYALGLRDAREAGYDATYGREIVSRMWDRAFEGVTGTVAINENGDRLGDYSLLDLNPHSGRFEVVANYYGNRNHYEPVPGKSIHWGGNNTQPPH